MTQTASRSLSPVLGALLVGAVAATAAVGAKLVAPVLIKPGPVEGQPNTVRLANGWKITPAGTSEFASGDMLIGSALSPDKKTLALVSAGFNIHAVQIIDTETGKITQSLPIGRGWNGVAWSPDSKTVYAGGGASETVHVFTREADGKFGKDAPLTLEVTQAKNVFQGGLGVSPDGKTLYVANTGANAILAVSLPDGKLLTKRPTGANTRPYALRVGADGRVVVALWGGEAIEVLDGLTLNVLQTWKTGRHPNDLLVAPDNKRVFVSCGNDDDVQVLDAQTGRALERVHLTVTPQAPPGATPCALSLSPDGKTLYVANSDNNDVAVLDVSVPGSSRVKGFIPTGWYPTNVCALPDGKRLLIASGKGMGTVPNPVSTPVTPETQSNPGFRYIGTMLRGMVSVLDVPTPDALAKYSKQVAQNSPYQTDRMALNPVSAPAPGTNPIPSRLGDPSPIKHILYIIKENRTYDQVYGDMKDATGKPIGNGDPNYTLFGETVTPNQHALARKYVLLDNVYCNGEVSADGHPWSDGALVSDFTQRTWPVSYGKKGDPPASPSVTVPPSGYIWDRCKEKGLSYRSYGEQVTAKNADAPPAASDLESADGATSLVGHASAAWQKGRNANRDYLKADVFIEELHAFEAKNSLPAFMVMSLGENHTNGTKVGAFTPKAAVASNDLGLAKIVEACSKSKYWKEMAIFVIEDDAQNGPDHVDAHRTTALVISPYVKRGVVDSTFYTTTSLLRTMELILGLKPMSQYDAGATPMYNSFMKTPELSAYTVLPAQIDLQAKNVAKVADAARMNKIDFSGYDHLTVDDEDALNRALWRDGKGNAPYPAPVRRALLAASGQAMPAAVAHDEDEDDRPRATAKPGKKSTAPTAPRKKEDDDD